MTVQAAQEGTAAAAAAAAQQPASASLGPLTPDMKEGLSGRGGSNGADGKAGARSAADILFRHQPVGEAAPFHDGGGMVRYIACPTADATGELLAASIQLPCTRSMKMSWTYGHETYLIAQNDPTVISSVACWAVRSMPSPLSSELEGSSNDPWME
jgi:hypothetical protein